MNQSERWTLRLFNTIFSRQQKHTIDLLCSQTGDIKTQIVFRWYSDCLYNLKTFVDFSVFVVTQKKEEMCL